ncbi:MAG: DEAD/DEAH box helicase [Pirellulaceae bacterium]|nr:DEAD/DEAH box helicase [Pirellulaceae bacterium]
MTTPYHAKYFAHELTRQAQPGGVDRLSMALFDACVDLNPHQIEAALFALRSPLSKGVVLADEVGLGKTIEAGLVLCQHWAERKRKLLVICPASLRKQWALELQEKFNLPSVILDSKTYRQAVREGNGTPFASDKVVITSFHFASRSRGDIRAVPYDLVVIDEAHKLRNAYRPSNKMGQNIKWAIEERKKCLLTATPLQNTLLELYGLSTILDDLIFGDVNSFRTQYTNAGADLNALRGRLQSFCQRTLRRQVVEYIQYTERIPFTVRFRPTDDEQKLYESVSDFLNREETYSVPQRQRHLTALILRKLLASSSHAIANTLETMKTRLEVMRGAPQQDVPDDDFMEELIENEELEDDYLDEILEGTSEEEDQAEPEIDHQKLVGEIDELTRYAQWARSIGIDTKSRSLLKALELGFTEMDKMGAKRKALVFTESRRTQDYLKNFLESNGYGGQIVLFNGTNADPDSRRIIDRWAADNAATGRVTGSRPIDSRTALIEYFQNHATVMIATEAAAEGVNMQFCSLVINYDLPWNPQRIEQRIGRCHRYGQKHDVVVINFLNERNEADRRIHELLAEKFNLFSGVFGASDEVLGQIESGVDFEKRILAIYQKCRTPQEIDTAFKQLQAEMDETIQSKMDETRQMLMEHFDEDVHARLKMRLDDARANLDRIGRQFWTLTRFVLRDFAHFDDASLTFELHTLPGGGVGDKASGRLGESRSIAPSPPRPLALSVKLGTYHLISKQHQNITGDFLYRLSHPLGEWSIDRGKQAETPVAKVTFDVTNYPAKVSVVEALKGKSGWLTLQYLTIDSFDREEYLLFSAICSEGETGRGGDGAKWKALDQETCTKVFHCSATVSPLHPVAPSPPPEVADRLKKEAGRHAEATITHSLEGNNALFNEERERLEKWAVDMVVAAEKDLTDTKAQIKAVRRQSRLATTLDEQNELQQKLRDLEKKQRKQRQQIFEIEDQIAEKRDTLIDGLQRRMTQKSHSTHLFTIQWGVI